MLKKFLMLFAVIALVGSPALAEEEAPENVSGTTKVDNVAAKALFDEGVAFIDTRGTAAWDLGRIPGAIHLDVKTDAFNKDALLGEVGLDEKVVIYCNGIKCGRSAEGCEKALEYGYKNVFYYREGFPGWKGAGYPTE